MSLGLHLSSGDIYFRYRFGATFRFGRYLGIGFGLHLGQATFRARATFSGRTCHPAEPVPWIGTSEPLRASVTQNDTQMGHSGTDPHKLKSRVLTSFPASLTQIRVRPQ